MRTPPTTGIQGLLGHFEENNSIGSGIGSIFENLIQNLPNGVIALDRNLIVVSWNKAMVTITGIEESRAIGTSALSLNSFFSDHRQLFEKAIEGNEINIPETFYSFGNEKHGYFKAKILPFKNQPDNNGAFVIIEDQSESKKNLEFLTNVLDTSFDSVVAYKPVTNSNNDIVDFVWTHVNPSAEKFLNKRSSELIGKKMLDVFPGVKEIGVFEKYVETVKTGVPFTHEFYYEHESLHHWFVQKGIRTGDGLVITVSDITERKRLELQVVEMNELLDEGQRLAKLGSWERDLVTGTLRWSKELYSIFELDEADHLDLEKINQDLIVEEDFTIINEAIKKMIANPGTKQGYLYRIKTHSGKIKYLEGFAYSLNNSKGEPYKFKGYAQDVTERVLSEQSLRKAQDDLKFINNNLELKIAERTHQLSKSRERFKIIASTTNDVLYDWNVQTEEIWYNDGFRKVFGFSEDEVDRSIESWVSRLHPEDKTHVFQSLEEAFGKLKSEWTGEYRFLKKDGTFAIILDQAYIIYDDLNKPLQVLGAMINISDKRNYELELKEKNNKLNSLYQEFQFLIDFIPQMVWITDPEGQAIFYNRRWDEFTGTDLNVTRDLGWTGLLHPEDWQRSLETWQTAVKTGTSYNVEYRLKRFDGEYRWVLARGVPIRDEAGVILKWFGSCTDIHDKKLTEVALEEMVEDIDRKNKELTRINEFMDTFVHAAAHDLKGPIAQMQMIVSLANKAENLERKVRFVDTMQPVVNKLDNTTRGLIELLKIQYDVNNITREISFAEICNIVMEEMSVMYHDVEFKVEFNFDTCPTICYVEAYLISIFKNLITNSIKYRDYARPALIKVSSERTADHLLLIFEDNGIGIDLEKFGGRLFIPFIRLTKQGEGTGIGLHLVKSIVEKNGGSIQVASEPGRGTTFKLHLSEY